MSTPDAQPPLVGDIFAINRVFIGEADRNGLASAQAWKAFGRNIDGLTTTSISTDVCILQTGSSKLNQVDGNAGIDNAWGALVLPLLQSLLSEVAPSVDATTAILAGAPTVLVQVIGLTSDPAQTASGLTAQAFATIASSSPPPFDTSGSFVIDGSSLVDHTTLASGAVAAFSVASITAGSFASGVANGPLIVNAGFGSVPFPLVLHAAVITFDHQGQDNIVNGTISGVLDTNELVTALTVAAVDMFGSTICGGTVDEIAAQMKQSQDILLDGTNNPAVACNGISIGIGFSAKRVASPTMAMSLPPPKKPCP